MITRLLLTLACFHSSVYAFAPSKPKNLLTFADDTNTEIRQPGRTTCSTRLYDGSKQSEEEEEEPKSGRNGKQASSKKKKKRSGVTISLEERFASGSKLKRLRSELESLRENLRWALALDDQDRVADLTKAIQRAEERDPDIVYAKILDEIAQLEGRSGLSADVKEAQLKNLQKKAEVVRSCLSQFQLEGLWVGNYGAYGQQLINVTYTGDTLVATKATGDVNVPRGQVSFTCNLAPAQRTCNTTGTQLEPLKLSVLSSKRKADSSTASLTRFPGQGQVAKAGFTNNKFVQGQLILLDGHFSFVWIPTRHTVLYRRPTPEQTLELLRNIYSKQDELENMREHLTRCLDMDMTDSLARYHANGPMREPFRRISSQQDLEEWEKQQHGVFSNDDDKAESSFLLKPWKFMQVRKWKRYIDSVLGDDSSTENHPNPGTV